MEANKSLYFLKWTAWIYGGIIVLLALIVLTQVASGDRILNTEWQSYVLVGSLTIGLVTAYKYPLIGGSITIVGILMSEFLHPVAIAAGALYIAYGLITGKN